MARKPDQDREFAEGATPPSPYDTDPPEELSWFAPPGAEDSTDDWRAEDSSAPGWHDPAEWAAAEARAGPALADAAVAVARLDERLRRMAPERAAGLRRRLALMDTSDLLWAEGVRLRPEHLALADEGRVGRTGDEDQVFARASWAIRRLLAAGGAGAFASEEALRGFLGLHGVRPEAEAPVFETLWRAVPEASALADWRAALAGAPPLQALTRAAMGFHLWRGFALAPPGQVLEPAVIAARLGAPAPGAAPYGLTAIPIALGNPGLPGGSRAGTAEQRLAAWLALAEAAAGQAQGHLDRVDAWEMRAEQATRKLQGKGAPALISHLAAHPITSANRVAAALSLSPTQARALLNRFERLGLIRELTGHSRFRFWQAAL